MGRGGPDVERVCFLLRVRQDRLDEYKAAHRSVWPEMLEAAMSEYLVPPMRRIEEVFHLE